MAQAKATYRIPPEGVQYPRLADPQRPLLNADVFDGEPGASGLMFEADHAWYKPRCDVLLHACAHAPGGQPVKRLDVGFRVGSCLRTARVVGDRVWRRGLVGLAPSEPEAFVSMPIGYSRAFGGTRVHEGVPQPFADNPVGCGFGGAPGDTSLVDTPVPNLEEPGAPIDNPRERYRPISFGPVGRSWAGRVKFGGTYDQRWVDEVFPLLPEDFDPRFFQAAPVEQQIDYPTGGEEVSFIHLHPSRPELRFVLPRLSLPLVVLDQHRRVHKLEPVVDTLSFDLDADVFSVVWRARHPLKRSLTEVDALAAGSLCKRWWKARVLGTNDCGCGGFETKDEDLAPVSEIVSA